MSSVHINLVDESQERSGFRLAIPDIDSVNIDDYITPVTGYVATLTSTLNAITLGTITNANLLALERVVGTALPTNKFAQREMKALVRYHDSITGNRFVFTIPTIDNQYKQAGSDMFNITGTEWAAFIDVLESAFVSPDGNLMIVDSAKFVGRNI